MKYVLIGAILICAYVVVAVLIARFCGINSRLEEELEKDDRSNSN
jgi:hypothetical protein